MEIYKIENLTFTYPNQSAPALDDINLSVNHGEFITICGKSGSGKSTLLRHMKPILAPRGDLKGQVLFFGKNASELDMREQCAGIGFVMQSPDNQIVTDKVWHELAFGLESLGYSNSEIRARVSETASFFGIQTWFLKNVSELSGGQKQLLNLASIMAMQPDTLILDEPTSQLDPIAAQDFLKAVEKINRELGTTVILTEHRLEDVFDMSDRVIVMDSGRIIADGTPKEVGKKLRDTEHDMTAALPAPMRIYAGVENDLECPVTVREGRKWLEKIAQTRRINSGLIVQKRNDSKTDDIAVELRDVWFRYDMKLPDAVKGLSVKIKKGEFYAIVGGNGTGKTTALSIMSGILLPYRGKVFINGQPIEEVRDRYKGVLGVLPQNPQTLFVKKTLELDLYEMLSESGLSKAEKADRINEAVKLCGLEELLARHPYDLSGGEAQRAALAKVLLLNPKILFMDEPTKGMDAHFKEIFAGILRGLLSRGATVVMVSHDIEFCARYADKCAMFFDGAAACEGNSRDFFAGKSFYTTSANRMARGVLPKAVLAEDVIAACGGNVKSYCSSDKNCSPREKNTEQNSALNDEPEKKSIVKKPKFKHRNMLWGGIFGILFLLTLILFCGKYSDWRGYLIQAATILELALCMVNFIPQNRLGSDIVRTSRRNKKIPKRTIVSAIIVLVAVPFTIFAGMHYLQDRKYYFISLLIIFEIMIPIFIGFEQRKVQARELVVISVLCAAAVAGRIAFSMLPQFKPTAAVVIIAGVCFGSEMGFFTGAVSGFVSNFFFGQGPLTPWQMFAFGLVGFIAGALFETGFLKKTKGSLMTFGGLAILLIYGVITNSASALLWQDRPNAAALLSACAVGLPFDLIHAASTMFFLWFISEPMIEKLERIKVKYGILKR